MQWVLPSLAIGAVACGGDASVVKGVEIEHEPFEQSSCRERSDGPDFGFRCTTLPDVQIDLLFVIDDGPSGLAWQIRLADAMPAFAQSLSKLSPGLDLRIAFTTAHDGNPACEAGPGSSGRLWLASCREHPEDFAAADGGAFESTCAARCGLDDIDVIDTALHGGDPEPRPWIEMGKTGTNLPAGVAPGEALSCAALLGNAGCTFSAPLGNAWRTVLRARDGEPDDALWRSGALPIVVFVSGGIDCSVTSPGTAAFTPDGDRALWSDPGAESPTPALCWAAAVSCSDPARSGELTCTPHDVDPAGEPAPAEEAVLHPVEWFLDTFVANPAWASPWVGAPNITLFAIAGVPLAFERGAPLTVQAARDPAVAAELGVEPTCRVNDSPVVPAVRLAALAEQAADRPEIRTELLSACADDYGPALARVAEAISGYVRPNCYQRCVHDVDVRASGLQVECMIEAELLNDGGDLETIELGRCGAAMDGSEILPEGARACWAPRVGDAMHQDCTDGGWNLEVVVHWAPGLPTGRLDGTCTPSEDAATDCPGLG